MVSGVPLVGVTRGPRLESVHAVAACACDVEGNVLLALGTIDEPVFLRSAAKPFITAAGVRAGTLDRFGFDNRELAVISASHNGEAFQVDAVRAILAKIGATVDDLCCGAHAPSYAPAAQALREAGERPTALHNNCSGKHAGILALAMHLGADAAGYLELTNPAESAILDGCAEMLGVPPAGLIDRLFAGGVPDDAMQGAVARARAAGVRTGLVSNSWGTRRYDRALLGRLFDGVVISGEIGIRKPTPEIYERGAQAIELSPRECVFVDDLPFNLPPAAELGMATVHHTDSQRTIDELEQLLGTELR